MTAKERKRHEISEAFDFLRYLIRNPKEIKNIKDGSAINILCKDFPLKESRKSPGKRSAILQVNYLSEHIFHRV